MRDRTKRLLSLLIILLFVLSSAIAVIVGMVLGT